MFYSPALASSYSNLFTQQPFQVLYIQKGSNIISIYYSCVHLFIQLGLNEVSD